MKYLLLILLITVSCTKPKPEVPITTSEMYYQVNDQAHKGYFAKPDGAGPFPGVIIVHEWWGHNAYVQERARMLAKMGYAAFALDMYGDGKNAAHPKEAGEFSGAVFKNFDLAKARFNEAMEILKEQPGVDKTKIAAIGYCFGGGIVLNMARQGADLKAVVSFHGMLGAVQKATEGSVKGKLLVLNGADDPMIKPEDIDSLKKEMEAAKAQLVFINYPGAKHAFTNPGATALGEKFKIPIAYDKAADEKSWEEMKQLFKQVL
jgi:dienelactone hydrolase